MDNALKIMKKLEDMGKKQFLPSIGPVKGKVIEKIVKKYKPKTILEIGTLYGYSAILMARLLPKDGKLITIDIDERNFEIAKKNIEESGLSNKIEVVLGDALHIIPKIQDRIDLLFIDGAKKQYYNYLKLAEKNLDKGNIVVADNVLIFEKDMKQYLDYVRKSGKYKSSTIKTLLEFSDNIEDALEISVVL